MATPKLTPSKPLSSVETTITLLPEDVYELRFKGFAPHKKGGKFNNLWQFKYALTEDVETEVDGKAKVIPSGAERTEFLYFGDDTEQQVEIADSNIKRIVSAFEGEDFANELGEEFDLAEFLEERKDEEFQARVVIEEGKDGIERNRLQFHNKRED